MAQIQFRSDDTTKWEYGFGRGIDGNKTVSSNTTETNVNNSIALASGEYTTTTAMGNFTSHAGRLVLIHQTRGTGAGQWHLNRIQSIDGSNYVTLKYPSPHTYTDSGASQAQMILMREYKDVTVNSGITWTAQAWDGNVGGILAFFASGTVTVTGNITGTAKGYIPYPTQNGSKINGKQGEGTAAAGGTDSRNANGNGGGGGSCFNDSTTERAGGGGGGNGAAGNNGLPISSPSKTPYPGTGGSTAGNAGLTTVVFGGAGGGGGSDRVTSNTNPGGLGGGFVLVIAKSISISGGISCSGQTPTQVNGSSAGGGGGGGGSILIKAGTATLGTTKLVAIAGSGSAGAGGSNGGAGGVGRIHLDYKTSYTGTTNPTLDARQDLSLSAVSSGFLAFM